MSHVYLPVPIVASPNETAITHQQIQELVDQWNERRLANNQASVIVPQNEDPAFYLGDVIAQCQAWIETYGPGWLQSHNLDGTLRPEDYFHNKYDLMSASAGRWTLANLWQSAFGNSSGWTQWDGTTITRGRVRAGDAVCVQQINELVACLDRLRWSTWGTAVNGGTQYTRGTNIPNSKATYAEAVADAKNIFASTIVSNDDPDYFGVWSNYGHSSTYSIAIGRSKTRVKATSVPTAMASAADFYGFLEPNGTFDTHGDLANALPNRCYRYHVGTPATTAERYSNYVGNTDQTNYPTINPENSPGSRGYGCHHSICVLRWDVPGGFTYY